MNTTPEDPNAQSKRRPARSLPGGGSLTLVQPPDSQDQFLKAMDLRRGSVGNPMDEDAACELFEIAANEGHKGASAAIALLCEGRFPPEVCKKHFNKAKDWILSSAEKQDEWGLLFLGIMYFDGYGVEQNYEQAASYFQQTAENSNACAQGFLGYMHSVGHGVLQNRQAAVGYFRAAADQGHVVAQFDLGVCYAQGRGVPKDKRAAISWFKLAGERGDLQARALLAKITV